VEWKDRTEARPADQRLAGTNGHQNVNFEKGRESYTSRCHIPLSYIVFVGPTHLMKRPLPIYEVMGLIILAAAFMYGDTRSGKLLLLIATLENNLV